MKNEYRWNTFIPYMALNSIDYGIKWQIAGIIPLFQWSNANIEFN